MNCELIERRLLAAERPDHPDAEVKRHLADCASCRAMQKRLVQLERDIPQVAVPLSTRRPVFVQQFLQQTPVEVEALPEHILPLVKVTRRSTPIKERGMRKLVFAAAFAASLAVCAVGLLAMHFSGTDKTPDYAFQHRVHLDTRARLAETPSDKAEVVLGVADEVRAEVRSLAEAKNGKPKQLADLAKLYRQLVQEDLDRQVKDLPEDAKRKVILERYERRLQENESEFSTLAAMIRGTSAEQPLLEMAQAAHEMGSRIHEMLQVG